jgi:hypothetical protein
MARARSKSAHQEANETMSFMMKPDWIDHVRKDDIFPEVEIKDMETLTGIPATARISKAIVSGGKIIHVASQNYGLLKNEDFFIEAERKLIDLDIQYVARSINRANSSFAVDYILNDPRWVTNVKSGVDIIRPMLRLSNSYDGSSSVFGNLAVYRQVCSNGLHVSQSIINFKVRHKKDVMEVVMPNLQDLISKFIDNEFFSLHKKFEVLAERKLDNLEDFVAFVSKESGLFSFYKGGDEERGEISASAETVMHTILKEANLLDTKPNVWLGYNAFNEFMHDTARSFANQRKLDATLFDIASSFS